MDDLVRELNELRITSDEAARAYQRTLKESSRRERAILVDIQCRQQQNDQFTNNIRNNRINLIVAGDIVRITNEYNTDEFGIVGVSPTSPDAWLNSVAPKHKISAHAHGGTWSEYVTVQKLNKWHMPYFKQHASYHKNRPGPHITNSDNNRYSK